MKAASSTRQLRIGIAGLGAIGHDLAWHLDAGIPGMVLEAVAVRDHDKARAWLSQNLRHAPDVVDLKQLAERCDIVIECAPAALLPEIATPVLALGKKVIVLSAAGLLANPRLIAEASLHGGQIMVPTGALLGLDAVTAAAEGKINAVRLTTRKPVRGLLGAPYLEKNDIRIEGITEPMRVFAGNALEAALGFPANVNVAAALSLAGIGPDRTQVEIWADPALTRNIHSITVDADSASFTMSIENIPSDNPKTGRITALSVVSLLRKLTAPLRIGS